MMSKNTHILLSLPRPSDETFKDIENIVLKVLWHDKPPKLKISILENLTGYGRGGYNSQIYGRLI